MCLCVCGFSVLGEMLCEKRSLAFFLGSNNNFVISWYNTLEWISLVGWFLAFLCHCAAHLSVNLLTQAAKMPFDIFSSLWVLFIFFAMYSTAFLVFLYHKIVPLSFACLRWMEPGWGVFEWFGMQRQHHSVSLQEPLPYLLNGLWAREQKQREAEWEWFDSLQRAGRKLTADR